MNMPTPRVRTRIGAFVPAVGALFAITLYINLSRILLGTKYFLLAGDVMVGMLLFAAVIVGARRGRFLGGIELLTAAFCVLGLIELFHPNVPSLQIGLESFRRLMFQMLGLVIGIAAVRRREDVTLLWKLLALCAVPIFAYAIKQFFVISDLDYSFIQDNSADIDTWQLFGKVRSFGFFSGPFHLGVFAGIMFWLSLALRRETGQFRYSALATLAAFACVASLTRSSMIALAASVPLTLFLALKGRRTRVIKVTLGVLATLSIAFVIAWQTVPVLSTALEGYNALESLSEDNRLQNRFEDYTRGVEIIKDNPLGAGMGSASDALGAEFASKGGRHITAHNMFFWVLVETGFAGLLIFVGIVAGLVLSIRQLIARHDVPLAMAATGSLIVVLISGITGSTLSAYPVNLIFWTLAGCYIGYTRLPAGAKDIA